MVCRTWKKESDVSGNIDNDDDFMPAPKKNRHVRFDEKPTPPQRQSPCRPVISPSTNLPKQKNIVEDATTKQTTVVKNRSEKKTKDRRTQKLNIRCNPYDVIMSIWIMNDHQREAVARKCFQSIPEISTDGLVVGSSMNWLMDKMDPVDMTIRPGRLGKELKITKETICLILGLPTARAGKLFMDWYGEVDVAGRLRKELKISKDEFDIATLQEIIGKGRDDDLTIRCFFLILFNRLLFPTSSWSISKNEVLMT